MFSPKLEWKFKVIDFALISIEDDGTGWEWGLRAVMTIGVQTFLFSLVFGPTCGEKSGNE